MIIRWHGQSAYTLTGSEHTVAIDPFGPFPPEVAARITFDYPPIEPHPAHLLLVTHEHRDHNAVEAISGDPHVVRSTAGRFETPVGDVVAIASEHDDAAGTARGPNTIFVFTLDGVRIAHFGDFGQTGPSARAAGRDRRGRPPVHPRRRRADDRRARGGDRPRPRPGPRRPDALPHPGDRLPRAGRRLHRDVRRRRARRRAGWSVPGERPAGPRVVVLQPPGA